MPAPTPWSVVAALALAEVGRLRARIRRERDRRASEAVRRSEREGLERAFEQGPVGVAVTDLRGRVLHANAKLRTLTGGHPLVGRTVRELLHPDDVDASREPLRALLRGEVRSTTFEQRLRGAGGRSVWVRTHVSLGHDATGRPVQLTALLEDVTDAKARQAAVSAYAEQLKARSGEDPLTGLRDRRQLDDELARRTHGGSGRPFALALLTLSGLRRVNDHQGFAAGDGLLRAAADAVRALAGPDLAFRFGGATLALLLPDTGADGARERIETLRERIEVLADGVRLVAGVGTWPADGVGADLLVLRAQVEAQADRHAQAAEAAARPGGPLPEGIDALLRTAREELGLQVAWLSELRGDELVFRDLDGDARSFGLQADDAMPLSAVPCGKVLAGELRNAVGDVRADPVAGPLAATEGAGLGAYVGVPVELEGGRCFGMLCAAGHAARPDLGEGDARVLRALAALVARQLEHDRRREERQREHVEAAGLSALLAALDARDHYTGEHSEAVVALAGAVAERLGLDAEVRAAVEQVALLHDIGKIGIPDSVLQKDGPLDDVEWDLMRQHSVLGARIVASIGSLAHLAPAVRAEHERWDGRGYPDGLAGPQIPLASRIILATDALHAMTSDRPYRAALPRAEALAELERHAGTQFDPEVVAALVALVAPDATAGARR